MHSHAMAHAGESIVINRRTHDLFTKEPSGSRIRRDLKSMKVRRPVDALQNGCTAIGAWIQNEMSDLGRSVERSR
jgi:hypothetical protein